MVILFWILIVVILYLGFVQNYVFYLELQVFNGFDLIDDLLKERFDCIPLVVSVFKGHIRDEHLLEELILLHNCLYTKATISERIDLDGKIVSILEQITDGYGSDDMDVLRDLHVLHEKIEEEKVFYNERVEILNKFILNKLHCLVVPLLRLEHYTILNA